jgi:hypothetical protein
MNKFGYVRFTSAQFAGLWLLASISGCGSKVPFEIVPVHGKIVYENGSLIPADSILVTFNPILKGEKGKTVAPGGQTNVNVQDGTFSSVSSHRANDGVVLGRHRVVVVSFEKGPDGKSGPSAAIPAVYRNESSTPLEIDVESRDQFLELKISKN